MNKFKIGDIVYDKSDPKLYYKIIKVAAYHYGIYSLKTKFYQDVTKTLMEQIGKKADPLVEILYDE